MGADAFANNVSDNGYDAAYCSPDVCADSFAGERTDFIANGGSVRRTYWIADYRRALGTSFFFGTEQRANAETDRRADGAADDMAHISTKSEAYSRTYLSTDVIALRRSRPSSYDISRSSPYSITFFFSE